MLFYRNLSRTMRSQNGFADRVIEIRKCQLCPLRYWQKKYEFSARMKNVMFRGRKGEAKIIGVNSYLWTVTGRSHNF